MSALDPMPPTGSPDDLRATICELMAVLAIRAEIVGRSAQIRDDAAVAYGLRCLTAELRAALGTGAMLAQATEPERARRRAAHSLIQPNEVHS
jgi:hypothetical protein